jgi:cytochrome c nitrite reductase small subunit
MRVPIGQGLLALAVLVGAVVGLGAFTFSYGEGLSYFSKDPRACANCHIMNDQYNSWQKAGHHQAAKCVDCHLPHDFVGKYLAKADNGYRHSKAFTLQDFHEPIKIIDDRERLTLALVQKKVSELLGSKKFNNRFQIGMLASFESFLETAKLKQSAEELSNFDDTDLDEAEQITPGRVACNQVLYHLLERTIEHRVIPWCEQRGVAVVAYNPICSNAKFPRRRELHRIVRATSGTIRLQEPTCP